MIFQFFLNRDFYHPWGNSPRHPRHHMRSEVGLLCQWRTIQATSTLASDSLIYFEWRDKRQQIWERNAVKRRSNE